MIMAVKETGVSYYGLCYLEHARKDFEEMIAHNCNAVILALTEFDIDFWFPKHYWDYESCQGTGNEGLSGFLGNNHVSITALALHVLRDLISCHVMLFHATKYMYRAFSVFRGQQATAGREESTTGELPTASGCNHRRSHIPVMVPAAYQMPHPDKTASKYTLQGFHVLREMQWEKQRKYWDEFCLADDTVVADWTSDWSLLKNICR